jgi:hypothetical protein
LERSRLAKRTFGICRSQVRPLCGARLEIRLAAYTRKPREAQCRRATAFVGEKMLALRACSQMVSSTFDSQRCRIPSNIRRASIVRTSAKREIMGKPTCKRCLRKRRSSKENLQCIMENEPCESRLSLSRSGLGSSLVGPGFLGTSRSTELMSAAAPVDVHTLCSSPPSPAPSMQPTGSDTQRHAR